MMVRTVVHYLTTMNIEESMLCFENLYAFILLSIASIFEGLQNILQQLQQYIPLPCNKLELKTSYICFSTDELNTNWASTAV